MVEIESAANWANHYWVDGYNQRLSDSRERHYKEFRQVDYDHFAANRQWILEWIGSYDGRPRPDLVRADCLKSTWNSTECDMQDSQWKSKMVRTSVDEHMCRAELYAELMNGCRAEPTEGTWQKWCLGLHPLVLEDFTCDDVCKDYEEMPLMITLEGLEVRDLTYFATVLDKLQASQLGLSATREPKFYIPVSYTHLTLPTKRIV